MRIAGRCGGGERRDRLRWASGGRDVRRAWADDGHAADDGAPRSGGTRGRMVRAAGGADCRGPRLAGSVPLVAGRRRRWRRARSSGCALAFEFISDTEDDAGGGDSWQRLRLACRQRSVYALEARLRSSPSADAAVMRVHLDFDRAAIVTMPRQRGCSKCSSDYCATLCAARAVDCTRRVERRDRTTGP